MSLDIRTAVITAAGVYLVIALVFLFSNRKKERPFPGEGHWALGFGLIFLSQVLIGLRGMVPPAISIIVGNILAVLGIAGLAAGTEIFLGRKPALALYGALTALAFVVFVAFGYVHPDALWRVLGMNLAIASILIACGLRIRHHTIKDLEDKARWTSALLLLIAFLFLARTAMLPQVNRANWLFSGWPEAAILIVLTASFQGLAFLYSRLVALRLRGELDESLAEREFLLREMHHRTKNELALVQSILRLESADASALPGLAERLEVVGARVRSIGLVHDSLGRLAAGSQVRLDDYLRLVAESLSTADNHRHIDKDLAPLSIDSRRAVSVGLVVTELCLNSLLHAFPDGRQGRVLISLAQKDGLITVGVRDDGVGFEAGHEKKGFGSLLVESLAAQLRGSLVRQSGPGPGTGYELVFPLVESA